MMQMRSLILAKVLLFSWYTAEAFVALPSSCGLGWQETYSHATGLHGWFDNFWQTEDSASASRQVEYPEQYPATYESNAMTLETDKVDESKLLIRKLLKNTQLQTRPLTLAYQASRDGWTAQAFHRAVDGKGASVVLATTSENQIVGGYNPKGWASLGGARPSVAAFLYYFKPAVEPAESVSWQKLRKVGGGGLACAKDDPSFGISFGPDGLVIPLLDNGDSDGNKIAQSKLGTYFERGPEDLPSLFSGGVTKLKDIQIYVGIYVAGEDIPYSGGVLDMTSG
jgi:hypothetical protein